MAESAWKRKFLILVMAGVAIAALLLLAASLSHVQFERGKRLSLGHDEPPGGSPPGLTFDLDLFWRVLMWSLFILVPLSIIAVFIWPENLKYAIIRAVALALSLILLVLTIRAMKDFIEQFLAALQNLGAQGPATGEPGAGEGLLLGPVRAPRWTVFPFLLGGLAFLTLSGWWLWRLWLSGRTRGPLGLGELSAVAGAAAEELEAGGDLRDVVLRCYREMSELLSERQHVPFQEAMTAREFERQLRRAGVRDEHVSQLSRLFEEVRYGGRASGPLEEERALECLRAVERAYGPKEATA